MPPRSNTAKRHRDPFTTPPSSDNDEDSEGDDKGNKQPGLKVIRLPKDSTASAQSKPRPEDLFECEWRLGWPWI